jgi:hypothetical protein
VTREPRLWPWSTLLVGISVVELVFHLGSPWLWAGCIVLAIAGPAFVWWWES